VVPRIGVDGIDVGDGNVVTGIDVVDGIDVARIDETAIGGVTGIGV
jgi:hypothetical protein